MSHEIDTTVECPRCGATQDDADGFGVLYCEACKYCAHPSTSDGVCDTCGVVTDPGSLPQYRIEDEYRQVVSRNIRALMRDLR